MALQTIEGEGLPTDYWPDSHLSTDRGESSSTQFRGDIWSAHKSSQTTVNFVDRDYCYEQVATQITHDAGLAPIPYIGQKFLPHQEPNQQHTLS